MVNFNKLQITPSGDQLILDVSIDETNPVWSNNVVIKAIYIETNASIDNYQHPKDTSIVWQSVEGVKSFKDVFTPNVVGEGSFNDKLFYIWVKINHTVAAANGAPCDMSKEYYVGIVYNKQLVVQRAIPIMKDAKCSCADKFSCDDNILFTEFILKKQALDYAIEAGDLYQAKVFWQPFSKYIYTGTLGVGTTYTYKSNCNCHGN